MCEELYSQKFTKSYLILITSTASGYPLRRMIARKTRCFTWEWALPASDYCFIINRYTSIKRSRHAAPRRPLIFGSREINLTVWVENEKAKLRYQVSYLFQIVGMIAELVIMIMKSYVPVPLMTMIINHYDGEKENLKFLLSEMIMKGQVMQQ